MLCCLFTGHLTLDPIVNKKEMNKIIIHFFTIYVLKQQSKRQLHSNERKIKKYKQQYVYETNQNHTKGKTAYSTEHTYRNNIYKIYEIKLSSKYLNNTVQLNSIYERKVHLISKQTLRNTYCTINRH